MAIACIPVSSFPPIKETFHPVPSSVGTSCMYSSSSVPKSSWIKV